VGYQEPDIRAMAGLTGLKVLSQQVRQGEAQVYIVMQKFLDRHVTAAVGRAFIKMLCHQVHQ
jgi:hypothetical protein